VFDGQNGAADKRVQDIIRDNLGKPAVAHAPKSSGAAAQQVAQLRSAS
jgi:hypothetical protein